MGHFEGVAHTQDPKAIEDHLQATLVLQLHILALAPSVRVLCDCCSCTGNLERSLAVASTLCTRRVDPPTWCGEAATLCAGKETPTWC